MGVIVSFMLSGPRFLFYLNLITPRFYYEIDVLYDVKHILHSKGKNVQFSDASFYKKNLPCLCLIRCKLKLRSYRAINPELASWENRVSCLKEAFKMNVQSQMRVLQVSHLEMNRKTAFRRTSATFESAKIRFLSSTQSAIDP